MRQITMLFDKYGTSMDVCDIPAKWVLAKTLLNNFYSNICDVIW